MRRFTACLIIIGALASGCARALPSAAQYPAPIPSAAQPGVAGKGDVTYALKALEAVRKALREYEPKDALAAVPAEPIALPDDNVTAGCVAAPGKLSLLLCHFGPAPAQPVAQGLFWYDREGWQAQLYPAAPLQLTAERRESFGELGCQLGCYSGISQARQLTDQNGTTLLVVVNLGFTSALKAEEVQILTFKDDRWSVRWVPAPGDWYYGHTEVVLPAGGGLETFQLTNSSWLRDDPLSGYLAEPESSEHRRFKERWVRKGEGYMLKDRAEEPSSYAALVRVIHYLSRGADEKVRPLLDAEIEVEEARKALAQRPLRQGWSVTRWGTDGYLLDRAGNGKPDLGVRFERRGDEWVLAEIWKTDR